MNKPNQIELNQTHRYKEQSNGYQRERGRERAKWVKVINCMRMDGN